MRVRILTSALADLTSGRAFYEAQGEGWGEYFFDSVFSDIDSLALYGGIHRKALGYHRMLARRFPPRFITDGTRWFGGRLSRSGLQAEPSKDRTRFTDQLASVNSPCKSLLPRFTKRRCGANFAKLIVHGTVHAS
jgi:hypothetical protein